MGIVTTIDNQCEPSPQATFAYFGCTALIHSHQSHQPPVDLRSSYKTSRASSLSFPHHGANQSSQCPRTIHRSLQNHNLPPRGDRPDHPSNLVPYYLHLCRAALAANHPRPFFLRRSFTSSLPHASLDIFARNLRRLQSSRGTTTAERSADAEVETAEPVDSGAGQEEPQLCCAKGKVGTG